MHWLIPWMQALSGTLWLAVVVQRIPGMWRMCRGRGNLFDILGLPVPLNGLVQFGFMLRWIIWPKGMERMVPEEVLFWAGLYLASVVSSSLFLVLYFYRPKV